MARRYFEEAMTREASLANLAYRGLRVARIHPIRTALSTDKRPVVELNISNATVQVELSMILHRCGFKVLGDRVKETAEIEFQGGATTKGETARVELRVVDKASGKVLASDLQTATAPP